jgi:hypothetical protein
MFGRGGCATSLTRCTLWAVRLSDVMRHPAPGSSLRASGDTRASLVPGDASCGIRDETSTRDAAVVCARSSRSLTPGAAWSRLSHHQGHQKAENAEIGARSKARPLHAARPG